MARMPVSEGRARTRRKILISGKRLSSAASAPVVSRHLLSALSTRTHRDASLLGGRHGRGAARRLDTAAVAAEATGNDDATGAGVSRDCWVVLSAGRRR